jgi:hypothetical protein
MSTAHLSDPEILRTFRRRLTEIVAEGHAALGGGGNDVVRIEDWLRSDQQAYWKRQVRDREEAYQAARREWLVAEAEVRAPASRGPRRESSIEERVAMDKARRRRDEAEEKLVVVRKWLLRIERDCAPLVHVCRSSDLALHELGAKADRRLHELIDGVETYLAIQNPGSSNA